MERIVCIVLVYKKIKPIILFSHPFQPNLFQNAPHQPVDSQGVTLHQKPFSFDKILSNKGETDLN